VDRKHYVALGVAILVLIAVGRVVLTYRVTAQGFDEPAHVAAGMEWIQSGTYKLDPLHPPLARIAIGLPLYLSGERLPQMDSKTSSDFWAVGNGILYDRGHYLRNLTLARCGILPFLMLAGVLVFLWSQRAFGDLAAVLAVVLFTTTPIVLAFSGLAYTDFPAASTQFLALFVFTMWLKAPTMRSTWLLGIAFGLALLSKFTSLLFLPAAALAVLLCKRLGRDAEPAVSQVKTRWITKLALATAIAVMVLWGGYRFSVGPVREDMQLSAQSMPSFQHFPKPVGKIAREMILRDPPVPAPSLLRGLADAWVANQSASPAYLLGNIRNGGWWYFFLLGILVKTPVPFLVLSGFGLCALFGTAGQRPWESLAPGAAAVAILVITMGVKRDAGLRHVLVVFLLLAVVAGFGSAYLWRLQGSSRAWGRWLLAGLLTWQCISSLSAHSDYIAYFNEFAGHDPSRVLVTGCDLDCGQDLFRLSRALREKHISQVNIAVWSSADLSRMDLPDFQILQPFQPVAGWVAVSIRSVRLGDVLHMTYSPGALAWLDRCQPVAQVGKTIRLYYIAGRGDPGERGQTGDATRAQGVGR